jgi:hypothetical protein
MMLAYYPLGYRDATGDFSEQGGIDGKGGFLMACHEHGRNACNCRPHVVGAVLDIEDKVDEPSVLCGVGMKLGITSTEDRVVIHGGIVPMRLDFSLEMGDVVKCDQFGKACEDGTFHAAIYFVRIGYGGESQLLILN